MLTRNKQTQDRSYWMKVHTDSRHEQVLKE